MAYKYKFQKAGAEVDKDLNITGTVTIAVRNDAGDGKLGESLMDTVPFALADWPANKAALRTASIAAIVDRYPGATSE